MSDKRKTTLVYETANVSELVVCDALYHTKSALSYDMRPHKKLDLIPISYSTHSCNFYYYTYKTTSVSTI